MAGTVALEPERAAMAFDHAVHREGIGLLADAHRVGSQPMTVSVLIAGPSTSGREDPRRTGRRWLQPQLDEADRELVLQPGCQVDQTCSRLKLSMRSQAAGSTSASRADRPACCPMRRRAAVTKSLPSMSSIGQRLDRALGGLADQGLSRSPMAWASSRTTRRKRSRMAGSRSGKSSISSAAWMLAEARHGCPRSGSAARAVALACSGSRASRRRASAHSPRCPARQRCRRPDAPARAGPAAAGRRA